LSHLRGSAEESDVIEADVLTKTSLVRSKRKAFKKMPDRPLGKVIKRKQARREESQSRAKDTTPECPNIYSAEIFDTPYIRALHKRTIMFQVRYRADAVIPQPTFFLARNYLIPFLF
jgi:hypothetical protein